MTLVAGIISAYLWIAYVCPAIARLFHVPMAMGFVRAAHKNQHLSRRQYFWCVGVLGFGVGMFLLSSTDDYLRWKLLGDHRGINHLTGSLVGALAAGAIFGVWTSAGRSNIPKTDSESN